MKLIFCFFAFLLVLPFKVYSQTSDEQIQRLIFDDFLRDRSNLVISALVDIGKNDSDGVAPSPYVLEAIDGRNITIVASSSSTLRDDLFRMQVISYDANDIARVFYSNRFITYKVRLKKIQDTWTIEEVEEFETIFQE